VKHGSHHHQYRSGTLFHRATTLSRPAFTIVELLIVIVVIGVLATITIVAFNGVQERARASAVSAGLNHASKKLELYAVDNGSYPSALVDAGVSDGNNIVYQYGSVASPSSYCLTGTQGSTSYWVSNSSKNPAKGGCPGHGQGGVAAVTNLAITPQGTAYNSSTLFALNSTRWFGGSGGAGSYTSNQAGATPVGSIYARKTWTAAPAAGSNGDTGFDLSGYYPVNTGETYTMSAYLRPSITKQAQVGLYRKDSAGTALSREYLYNQVIPANAWTRINATYTIPAGVASIHVVFDISGSLSGGATAWAIGNTLDITGMMITAGPTLYTYADGASPDWIWNGTANTSTSTGPAL